MESYEMFTQDCSSDYLGLILSFYGKVKFAFCAFISERFTDFVEEFWCKS